MTLTEIKNSVNINKWDFSSPTLIRTILIFLVLIWILGFIQPVFLHQNDFFLSYFLERIYSRVCHQQVDKCLNISNENLLVCARCTGIYLGALFAAILTMFNSVPQLKMKSLIFALLPLFLDVVSVTIGIYNYSKILALISGLLFGGVVYLFLLDELEKFSKNKSIMRNE